MKHLILSKENQVLTITLHRPELHNAFNAEMIQELTDAFLSIKDERLVVLTGSGASFCAGADLNWMSQMKNYSLEENKKDSKKLSDMFRAINECPVPVIGKINGHALGGGVGLVSVCDYVVSVKEALFGFTEVRLGLIPAVISPYCIEKIGVSQARAWFLSGERFTAEKALGMNLVHEVTENLEESTQKMIKSFLQAGPEAARSAKKLVKTVQQFKSELHNQTVELIAMKRVSEEGQEGMRALLQKDKPAWVKK